MIRRCLHLLVLLPAFWPSGALAQPADTLAAGVVLARFTDARALAADAGGTLYVVDAGADVLVLLSPEGLRLAEFGGPGADEGEFDEPTDVDPTSGLLWVVADAGNSRLQRFSRTFAHLESLPVARVDPGVPGRTARAVSVGEPRDFGAADGRPVAVAVGAARETFAIDAVQRHVLKWDASRRLERAIGGFDAGAGALVEPTALAVVGDLLYVADRGQGAVLVYDLFGGFVRRLAEGQADDVRALAHDGTTLWIVLPDALLTYDRQGRRTGTYAVALGEPLADALPVGGTLYLLTPTRLIRARGR